MIYFEEMLNKYGFNDGESVVAGAFDYREVYLRVVNGLAVRNGSTRRMITWDRPGVHNPCMIVTVSDACFDALSPEERYRETPQSLDSVSVVENDEGLNEAVETAHEMSLDELVEIKVKIDKNSLHKTLRDIRKKRN